MFTGTYAINPVNGEPIPVWIADYVLMGYGTGAIMAVPCGDERDFEFARALRPADRAHRATTRPQLDTSTWRGLHRRAPYVNSPTARSTRRPDRVADAKRTHIEWLEANGARRRHDHLQAARLAVQPPALLGRAVPDRLRRGRQCRTRLPDASCRWCCPTPTTSRRARSIPTTSSPNPESPLDRLEWWTNVELDLGDGPQPYRRDTNVMPQWAGSCWYELRYLDPTNENSFVDPEVERYWMGPQPTADGHDPGGVDLYVGGVEHAVLHLLYARFWHKVLFDLGHVSSKEPYYRLFNQGYILAAAFKDEREIYVEATEVVERDGAFFYDGPAGHPRVGQDGQEPEERRHARRHLRRATAPTRCASTRWRWARSTRRARGRRATSSACTASCSGCGATSSTRRPASCACSTRPADDDTRRLLHRTIDGVRDDMEALRFNTAIAKLIELNNHLTKLPAAARRARSPSRWC